MAILLLFYSLLLFSISYDLTYFRFSKPDIIKKRNISRTGITTRTTLHTIHHIIFFQFLVSFLFSQFFEQIWFQPHWTSAYTFCTTDTISLIVTFGLLVWHHEYS